MNDTAYDPNPVVRALHNFVHITSSNKFDQSSEHYRASVICLGALFFSAALVLMAAIIRSIWFQPLRSKRITRHHWRMSAIFLFLASGSIVAAASIEGWAVAIKGVHGSRSELKNLLAIAEQLKSGGDFLVLGTDELWGEVDKQLPICPDIAPYIQPLNDSLTPLVQEFQQDTAAFPHDVDRMIKAFDRTDSALQFGLAAPLMLIVIACASGFLAVACNITAFMRFSHILGLGVVFVTGLVVTAEVMFSVATADLCANADVNAVELIRQVMSNETYLAAKYCATCEKPNQILAPLPPAESLMEGFVGTVYSVDNCTDLARDELAERAGTLYALMKVIEKRDNCTQLHLIWDALLHDNFCDHVVPGVAFLWIFQGLCILVLVLAIIFGHAVTVSYRHSIAFSFRARGQESAPLVGRVGHTDANVVPVNYTQSDTDANVVPIVVATGYKTLN
eukprot:c5807_g1_i1.p1 GENE.c5807_g1_i1~~c5807_g1_i1.p1  ORF type:complete len:460 (-),score=99.26 c5807_g1_i1:53-1402(-)